MHKHDIARLSALAMSGLALLPRNAFSQAKSASELRELLDRASLIPSRK
jgi:hypothetical protein